jgi:hypothetical protein
MGMSGQHRAPAALYPRGKDPRYTLLGDWVGPRAGLDAETKGKILCRHFSSHMFNITLNKGKKHGKC